MDPVTPMYAAHDRRMVLKVAKMTRRFKKRGRVLKGSAKKRWKWLELQIFGA